MHGRVCMLAVFKVHCLRMLLRSQIYTMVSGFSTLGTPTPVVYLLKQMKQAWCCLIMFDRWSLIVDLHFAAGTTVTQHAEVIVDSSFPGWELGRRATASANAHINSKIITVVTDAWYIYEIPAYYWQIIFHQIFTITATYNIGNWIRILLFYQFDSICIFWTSYFMARCDAKGGGHFFLDLGIGPDDGSARGQWRTSA